MPGKTVCFLTRLVPEPGPTLLREGFTEVRGNFQDRRLSRDELLSGVSGVDALYCLLHDTIDAQIMDAAGPRLKVISNMAVGYDNIDVEAATERGVLVTNTPGVLTNATADLAWALILAASRRVADGDRLMRRGDFHGWGPNMLVGRDVYGKSLGIVGMGRIGQAVVRRAAGFDMEVKYINQSGPLPAGTIPQGQEWKYVDNLADLMRESSIVSVHTPLTEETTHLIGRKELELLGPGGILINTARGPIIDESALVEALREGVIAAAGLDVYEQEPEVAPGMCDLENVVLLPHLGSGSSEARGRMAELAVLNAVAAVSGQEVPHPVNPGVA